MRIWDRGRYEANKIERGRSDRHAPRRSRRGRYALFQTDGEQLDDPPHGPARGPGSRAHAQAHRADARDALGELPRDEDNYGFEMKWDGVRSIAYVDGGRARFESRPVATSRPQYPEFRALGRQLGSTAAVLDGEIVAFESEGRPSFERLQRRMHVSNERTVRRLMGEVPVVYVIFDLLWLEGHVDAGAPLPRAQEAPRRARAPGAVVADARRARRGRRGTARRDETTRPRRCRRQAPRERVRGRPSLTRVAEGEEPQQPGVRDRRLGPWEGSAQHQPRRRSSSATTSRPIPKRGLRYAGRVGPASRKASCGGWWSSSSRYAARRARSRPRRGRRTPCSSSPSSSPRWSTRSGRAPEPSRACLSGPP